MKTKTTLIAALLMPLLAFCQLKGNIEFGIGAGYNSSRLEAISNEYLYYGNRNSVNFSVFTDFYVNDRWSFRGRVFYDRKGYNGEEIADNQGNVYYTDVNLTYITVPVTANWHFGKKRNWYLDFGPYVGFLASAKETTFNTSVKNNYNTVDGGIAFGIGVKIPLNNKFRVFIEYDYQSGIANVFKNDFRSYYGYYDYSDNNYTTARGGLNVGLNFLLK